MNMLKPAWRSLRRSDQRRPSAPGEHWLTFGAAVGLLRWAARTRSPWLRSATLVAGGLLALRAFSGRDGPVEQARRL